MKYKYSTKRLFSAIKSAICQAPALRRFSMIVAKLSVARIIEGDSAAGTHGISMARSDEMRDSTLRTGQCPMSEIFFR